MNTLKLKSLIVAALFIVAAAMAQAQIYTDLYDLTQATGSEPGFPGLRV